MLEHQVQFGARVNGPEEYILLAEAQVLERLFQREAFPRRSELGVAISFCPGFID